MVRLTLHDRGMEVDDDLIRRIGKDMYERRGAHLADLRRIKLLARGLAPLEISYDVVACQPPWFAEFTCKEVLGALFVTPQSAEIAAQVMEAAFEEVPPADAFDPIPAIMAKAQMDKYRLSPPKQKGPMPKRVAFIPGTNMFSSMLSRELLVSAMHRYPDMVVKPHPLTDEGTLRDLGRMFHYERIAGPMESGWGYLEAADEVYVTTATEMGLYASLMGKRIHNISHVRHEARGGFQAFYRLLWDLPSAEAGPALTRMLRSRAGGFIHPEDPNVTERLKATFTLAMELRKPYRPRVYEYDPPEYSAMVQGAEMRSPNDAVRPGEERPQERGAPIPDPL